MALYTGFATITGISVTGSTVDLGSPPGGGPGVNSVFGYAACFLDSLGITHTSTFTEHIGTDGEVAALQWVNEHLEISVTFRPVSSTSVTAANDKFYIIPKGAIVVLSGFKVVKRYPSNTATSTPVAPNADVLNGKWINCGDAVYTLNASAAGEIQLVLRNYLEKQTLLAVPIPLVVAAGTGTGAFASVLGSPRTRMTDATGRYLASTLPPRWQILGVKLLPLTLGHAHLLAASTDWRPWETGVTEEILLPGLFITSRPWRRAASLLSSRRAAWFAWRLGFKAARHRIDMQERVQVFADYLEVHTSGPECKAALRPRGERPRPTVPSGMPLLVWLRLFAHQELHLAEPLDAPFSDLAWLWTASLDAKGVVHTLNDDEFSFREWVAGQERDN